MGKGEAGHRTAAPRVVRLLAAGGPDPADGEITFHPRLTVLACDLPGITVWLTSLLSPHAAPDTLLEVDGVRARACDLGRSLRALPATEPLRGDALRAIAAGRPGGLTGFHRTQEQLGADLARWTRVRAETHARLAEQRAAAPRVNPEVLAEAARLRDEWRYRVHVAAPFQRRSELRTAEERRRRYEEYLSRFGAASCADLPMVGTGFGNTPADVAIREAATVASMAEQRWAALHHALERCRHRAGVGTSSERIDLGALAPEHADRVLARALADLDDTAYVRPLVLDQLLDDFSPGAREVGFARLVAHSRRRQTILVTACPDVGRLAAQASPLRVALCMDLAMLRRTG